MLRADKNNTSFCILLCSSLLQLLKGVTISQGGVLPHIPEVLLFRKSQMHKSVKPRPAKVVPAPAAAASITAK